MLKPRVPPSAHPICCCPDPLCPCTSDFLEQRAVPGAASFSPSPCLNPFLSAFISTVPLNAARPRSPAVSAARPGGQRPDLLSSCFSCPLDLPGSPSVLGLWYWGQGLCLLPLSVLALPLEDSHLIPSVHSWRQIQFPTWTASRPPSGKPPICLAV